jgi:hypothetical protein
MRWGEEAEEEETWGRVAESLIRARGISLGSSGVGLVQLRHLKDLVLQYNEAAGRKRGDARRRAKLCGEHRISG